jgi:hypothetical protein
MICSGAELFRRETRWMCVMLYRSVSVTMQSKVSSSGIERRCVVEYEIEVSDEK